MYMMVVVVAIFALEPVWASDYELGGTASATETTDEGRLMREGQTRVVSPDLVHRMIQVRKDDTLGKLAARYFWPMILKLNREEIEDPNVIYPGQWLLIPAIRDLPAMPTARSIHLAEVVFVTQGEGLLEDKTGVIELTAGAAIENAARIDARAGYISLRLGDGTKLRMAPNTSIDIGLLEFSLDGSWIVRFNVERGRVWVSQPEGGSNMTEFEIGLPVAKVEGASKSFFVEIGRDDHIRIANHGSNLRITSRGQEQSLPQGRGAIVSPTARQMTIVPTPLVPTDLIATTAKGPDVHFSWQGVPGAAYYNLVIANDDDLADVEFRGRVDKATQYTVRMFNPRKYFWTVEAYDREGIPGPLAATQSFSQKR